MKRIMLLSITLFMTVMIPKCGGVSLEKIQATDYFSGIRCMVPLEIPNAPPSGEYLNTNDSIDELNEKLNVTSKEVGTFTTKIVNKNAIMMVYSENSKDALYLIHQYTPNREDENYKYHYRFSDFSAYFVFYFIETEDGEEIRGMRGIPMPHYLFEELYTGHYYLDEELLVNGDIEAFCDFYRMFQTYYPDFSMEIKKEGDALILENIPVIFEIVGENDLWEETGIIKQIMLTFGINEENQSIVTFSWNEKSD